jgi:hypothetical protein
MFGWILGMDRGFAELRRGAEIRIPSFVKFIIKYVSPVYLLVVFGFWCYNELIAPPDDPTKVTRLGQIADSLVVQLTIGFIAIVTVLFLLLIAQAVRRWDRLDRERKGVAQ